MPLYEMPDGNQYEFPDDQEASIAMDAWQKQFQESSWSKSEEGQKPTEQLISELGESPLRGAALPIGIAETGLQMLSGTPAFVTTTTGKLIALGKAGLEGRLVTPQELEEGGQSLTPDAFHNITYDPRTKAGQLASRGLMGAFQKTGRGIGASVQAALEGGGQSRARELVEDQDSIAPALTSLGLDTAMVTSIGRSLIHKEGRAAKQQQADQAFTEAVKKQEEQATSEPASPLQEPIQRELDLGYPNQFKQRPTDLIRDENGIPIDRKTSLEAQMTERGGDLFSTENIKALDRQAMLDSWKEPDRPGTSRDYLKQQEIEQAYLEKARQDSLPLEESVTEPTQRGLGGVGRKGFGQGGAIDPTIFKDAIEKLSRFVSRDVLNKLEQPDYTGRTKTVLMPIDYFLKSAVEGTHKEKTLGVQGWFGKEPMKDTPKMYITKEGTENIQWGHEGRHRARAMKEAGLDYMPVEIRSDVPIKDLPQEYVTERGWLQKFPIPKEEFDIPNAGVFDTDPTPWRNRWNGRSPFGDGEPQLAPTLGGVGKKGFGQGGAIDLSPLAQKFKKKQAMAKMMKGNILDRLTIDRDPWEVVRNDPAIKDSVDGAPVGAMTNLVSGGRMAAIQSPSTFRSWAVEQIKGGMEASRAFVEHRLDNRHTGLMPKIYRMDKESLGSLWSKLQQITGKENVDWKTLPWTESERAVVESLFKLTDDLYAKINTELEARGLNKIKRTPNYIPSVFMGNFRISVTGKDAKGNPVNLGYLGLKNKMEAKEAVAWVKQWAAENGLEVDIGELTYNPKFTQKSKARSSIGEDLIGLGELEQLLAKDDPMVATLNKAWQDRQAKMALDHLQFKQHFKVRKGVFGAEGNKGWKDPYTNAKEGFEAIQAYTEAASQWLEMSKAQRELQKAFNEKQTTNPNDIQYAQRYYEYQTGASRRAGLVENVIDWAGEATGLGGTTLAKIPAEGKKFFIQNVLGFSPSFIFSQFTQLPQRFSDVTSFMKHTANLELNIWENWNRITAMQMLGKEKTPEMQYFEKFANDRGIAHPEIMEQSALKSDSAGSNIYQKYSEVAGKTISAPEVATRRNFFLTIAESLKEAGLSKEQAAVASEKLTSVFFVDYARGDRAMVFDKLGPVMGDLASSLSTFKINDLNQKALYIKNRTWTPLGRAMMVSFALGGLVGMYGLEEADALWRLAHRAGMVDQPSIKSKLLEMPDVITYGPTSAITGSDLGSKFSTANTLPDSLEEALFPLASKLGYSVEALSKVFSTPNEANAALLAWELSPTLGKAFIEEIMFREGEHTLNPRNPAESKGIRDPSGVAKRILGTRSLEERKEADKAYESQSITKAANLKKQKLTGAIASEVFSGNDPTELLQEYSKYGDVQKPIDNLTKFKTTQRISPSTREKLKMSNSADEQKLYKQKGFLFKK